MGRLPGTVHRVGGGFSISPHSFLPSQLWSFTPRTNKHVQECSMDYSMYCKIVHPMCIHRAGQLCVCVCVDMYT